MEALNLNPDGKNGSRSRKGLVAVERGMGDRVKLLGGRPSPFSTRVQIALELKGVDYEFVEEDLNNKSQLLLQSNPVYQKIPVLIHNANSISESLIILQYIDETWNRGTSLLPKYPYARAVSRFWASFVDDKLIPPFFQGVLRAEGADQDKAKEETLANFQLLEGALGSKPFFGGEEIGYVDIALGSLSVWIKVIQEIGGVKLIDPHNTPLLHAWIHRFSTLPSVNKFLPHFDELLALAYGVRKRALGEA